MSEKQKIRIIVNKEYDLLTQEQRNKENKKIIEELFARATKNIKMVKK